MFDSGETSTSTDVVALVKNADQEATAAPAEPKPKIHFRCAFCALNELCEFKGTHPPFARQINFSEECYVMKDPFSPAPGPHSNKTNSEYVLVLGADCALCGRAVCKANECSIFYAKTYCLTCASGRIKEFPVEIQSKIRKQQMV